MLCVTQDKGDTMKVLISQPMKGLSNEQIKANREKIVEEFKRLKYEVIDSVFDFEDIEGVKTKPLFYLAKEIVERRRVKGEFSDLRQVVGLPSFEKANPLLMQYLTLDKK